MKKIILLTFLLMPMYLFSQVDTSGHFQLLTGFYNDFYSQPFERNFNVYYAGFGYKSPNTSIFGKVHYNTLSNKLNDTLIIPSTTGIQYELDYYQRLSKSTTSWWNYAYSNGAGFPNHRFIMRVWQELPKSFLVSAGMSYYNFNDNNSFFINAAVEKYFGNNWVELRVFTFFEPETAFSYYMKYRRFFKDINYLQLTVGYGPSDDNPWDINTFTKLNSYRAGILYVTNMGKRFALRTGVNYSYENYIDDNWRNRYSLMMGLTFNIN